MPRCEAVATPECNEQKLSVTYKIFYQNAEKEEHSHLVCPECLDLAKRITNTCVFSGCEFSPSNYIRDEKLSPIQRIQIAVTREKPEELKPLVGDKNNIQDRRVCLIVSVAIVVLTGLALILADC